MEILGLNVHHEEQKLIEDEKRSSEQANIIPDSPLEPYSAIVMKSKYFKKNGQIAQLIGNQ